MSSLIVYACRRNNAYCFIFVYTYYNNNNVAHCMIVIIIICNNLTHVITGRSEKMKIVLIYGRCVGPCLIFLGTPFLLTSPLFHLRRRAFIILIQVSHTGYKKQIYKNIILAALKEDVDSNIIIVHTMLHLIIIHFTIIYETCYTILVQIN